MVTVIKKSLFPNKMRLKINKDKLQILFLYVCQVYNEKRSSELSLTACKKCLQNRSKYTIAVFRTDIHLSQKSSKSKDPPPIINLVLSHLVFLDVALLDCQKLFWSAFSCFRTEYWQMFPIFPYLARMRENADHNKSEYGHFLCSDRITHALVILCFSKL